MLLYQILAFTIHGKFLKSQAKIINNNNKFELPAGSYSVSDIQDYFEYTLKQHGGKNDNSSIRKYVSKIENRITFEIKTRYYLELLTSETMKLFESTKSKIAKSKDENGQNVPNLEIQ